MRIAACTALTAHAVFAVTALVSALPAQAEPYLAVRTGYKCSMCHENPTGGGLRTTFGNIFAQNLLAERQLQIADAPWTGAVNRFLSVGADLRAQGTVTDVPGADVQDEFGVEELRLYLQLNAIPERLALYADQRLAPGSSSNLEAYGKLWFGARRFYLKAGQMYLPFGLRLEDDSAFIRTVPGINMNTPDSGVELGFENASWAVQLAASNGTAGATETDQGKQWSAKAETVQPRWRIGVSANFNDSDAGDRTLLGAFAGLRTGPVVWLAELDHVNDKGFSNGTRQQWVGLIEADWAFRKGHNLKLTAEGFDPDADVTEDQQCRYSLLWEYSPWPYLQLRLGARVYDGIPQNDTQNRRALIGELHAFF